MLAGREEHVELARIGLVGDRGGEAEELVGRVTHGAHDDDEVRSGRPLPGDPPGDALDPIRPGDRRAAELLHDEGGLHQGGIVAAGHGRSRQRPSPPAASTDFLGGLTDLAPNDPKWEDVWDENNVGGKNWSMELIKMPTAWQLKTGDRSVPVAIVDAGIDFENPDLAPNADTYNTDLAQRVPGLSHGTHVAGIACAKGNNGIGVTGVAWDCSLRGYELGSGTFPPMVAAAMVRAADDGARVVNLSLGFGYGDCGPGGSADLQQTTDIFRRAIQTVIDQGHDVLWVVAAGNSPCDAASITPANLSAEFSNVITVASVDDHGELSSFSSFGSTVNVAAAGGKNGGFLDIGAVNVLSTLAIKCEWFSLFCSEYGYNRGTSMAAPQVTGLAALVLSAHPTFTGAEIRQCIVTSAGTYGAAIANQFFHVIDAPSAIICESTGFTKPALLAACVPTNSNVTWVNADRTRRRPFTRPARGNPLQDPRVLSRQGHAFPTLAAMDQRMDVGRPRFDLQVMRCQA